MQITDEPSPQFLVVDADGTLFHLTESVGTTYARILRDFGYSVTADSIDVELREEWKAFQPLYLNSASGHATTPEREVKVWLSLVRSVLTRVSITTPSDEIVHSIYSEFAKGASRTVNEDMLASVIEAKAKGLSVVVATNNDERIRQVVAELGLSSYFSDIITAGELGWKKPSVRFFYSLAERLGTDLGNILHIGNDEALDVQAARNAGCRAELYLTFLRR
jgi:putative hydrolase of the HAD superfamily